MPVGPVTPPPPPDPPIPRKADHCRRRARRAPAPVGISVGRAPRGGLGAPTDRRLARSGQVLAVRPPVCHVRAHGALRRRVGLRGAVRLIPAIFIALIVTGSASAPTRATPLPELLDQAQLLEVEALRAQAAVRSHRRHVPRPSLLLLSRIASINAVAHQSRKTSATCTAAFATAGLVLLSAASATVKTRHPMSRPANRGLWRAGQHPSGTRERATEGRT